MALPASDLSPGALWLPCEQAQANLLKDGRPHGAEWFIPVRSILDQHPTDSQTYEWAHPKIWKAVYKRTTADYKYMNESIHNQRTIQMINKLLNNSKWSLF